MSRQKRFPALGFLTLLFSLLNSLLLVVQTVLVNNNNNNNNKNNNNNNNNNDNNNNNENMNMNGKMLKLIQAVLKYTDNSGPS